MKTSEKNTPGPLVIGLFAIIILMIIFYLVISVFFPEFLENLNLGKVPPIEKVD